MKKISFHVFSLILAAVATAQTIPFAQEFDLSDYKGQTYLSFMEKVVKPAIDTVATEGYTLVGAEGVELAYNLSHEKVQRKVQKNGGLEKAKEIAAALEGETVTAENLPNKIKAVDRSVNVYDMAAFLGLASGGGVSIKYATGNYSLNVHYDVTEERSGRSFGVAPDRLANDASDQAYLDDLQAYSSGSSSNLKKFYTGLLGSLLNSDSSGYKGVTKAGQGVLTDFLAVFTAEQGRNLMDGRVSPHWDAALLEVTLLAAFHAGQDEFKLFYMNPGTQKTTFTSETLKQKPCVVPTQRKKATMEDYWQFSRRVNDPANCKRSGINITKKEFRLMGEKITTYVYENNQELYDNIVASMELDGSEENLFEALSEYLITSKADRKIDEEKVEAITQSWIAFLEYARESANDISAGLE